MYQFFFMTNKLSSHLLSKWPLYSATCMMLKDKCHPKNSVRFKSPELKTRQCFTLTKKPIR